MAFVGVDLAWGTSGHTGICIAREGKVVDSALVRTDEEILDSLRSHTAGPCLVAIDAPLIVRNETGRRPCERIVSRCFGRYHAGAHSSNLAIPSFRAGVRAERLAELLDLDVDPRFVAGTEVRRAIEVYPHPAIIALFGLERILRYKAKRQRTMEMRREAFMTLLSHLEGLTAASPPLDVTASPRWPALREGIEAPRSGAELNRLEDELDSYVCAYIAAYYWTHGEERCRIIGDTDSGYIVTPATEEIARCLDTLAGAS